jgi:hypothetical protein
MEISGISDEEERPLITQSRKDSRYIDQQPENCKVFRAGAQYGAIFSMKAAPNSDAGAM